ncbi:hypothetical protein DFJ58DRAFT_725693 [Suillus subalutaceus]|uniref:uncharacterized protein n=1 Tax=Suillus subalutaceus TaxID=48586 RepID=UPI001B869D8E|nr:uncharacterized protein DFJ58DRAFT_725693 [Suillus subalutaceus]KAG1861512.1 hypothetical protein DFJ58DRAFT_725693 [Suillus subalutaceus]
MYLYSGIHTGGAYTKHQHLCLKGKKRLFSALSKAKELLSSVKRSWVDSSGRYTSSTLLDHLPVPSSSCDQANEVLMAGTSIIRSTPSVMHPSQEVLCDSSLHSAPTSANLSMQIDEGLLLAQRRSQCTGVPMPWHYRQYDDVLPQPPPSIPFRFPDKQPQSNLPENSIDAFTRTHTPLSAPPFRTARNVFGLVRQFFSLTPPSHDPEEVVTLTPAELPVSPEPHDISLYPYPNKSSFELGHWYWNGGVQKSHQSFKELIDIVGCPDFDPDDVRNTHWDKINSQLGMSANDEEGEVWEDEDPGARPYVTADRYHQPLISVIHEKLSNAEDDELFHYEPYQL